MINFPATVEGSFNFDGFNFRDYGSAFSKVLLSRLPKGLSVEISNVNPPVLPNGEQDVTLVRYVFEFEATQDDKRDLNFMANGFMPEPDGFIEKLEIMIRDQIHNEQQALASSVPLDNQKVTFHVQPVILAPVGDDKMVLTTTFKVSKND